MGEGFLESCRQIKELFKCVLFDSEQNGFGIRVPLVLFIILFVLILWNDRKRVLFNNDELGQFLNRFFNKFWEFENVK